MKRLILAFALIYYITNSYATENNLYEKFKDYSVIKVFLEDVINETDNPAMKTDIFRNVFKKEVEERQEMKFIYSNDKNSADVAVIVRIKNYTFTENAMPFMFSSASLVADSLSPKSSGKLVVDYEATRPSDGKALLHYKSFTTEERRPQKDMVGERGFINSVDKNVNRFIYKAFYKPENR